MARTNIEVIVTVRDGASKPLDSVAAKLRQTGKAAKDSTADIWQFNKTIFSTIAFLNLFQRGFGGLRAAMDLGAPLEKLQTQYERVLGPKGGLMDAISRTTNSIIDDQVALESGLKLGQLGLVKSSDQAGKLLAKFAVAARMAGKEGSEGVKDLTDATAGINIAKLEEYGILQKSNPALMAQFAIINKSAGILGNAAVKMQQMALIQRMITEHTKEHMFMFKSVGELVTDMGTSFKNLRQQIGILIATALRPLMEKLIPLMQKLKGIVEDIYRNDKQIMFLVKSVLALGAALSGLLATLGTLKLMVKLLGFAGVGFPGLIMAVVGLGAAFLGLTKDADGVLEKFRVIGAVFKGIYELVTNLDPETGMSKISKSTRDLLEKYGLLGFVKTIARIVAIIKTVVQDIYKVFKSVIKFVNTAFGGMFDKFRDTIASFTSTWTTWWTSDAISPIEKFVRAATVVLAPLLAFFAFKGLKWGLGKVAGGFFGRGGGNDGSSPTKALWVQTVGSIGGTLGGIGGALKGALGGLGGWLKNLPFLQPLFQIFTKLGTVVEFATSYGFRGLIYALSESVMPILRLFGTVVSRVVSPILVFGSALWGFAEGIIETAAEWGKFFTGIWDLGKAVVDVTGSFLSSIPYVKELGDAIKSTVEALMTAVKTLIIDLPMMILTMIKDGWKNIGSWASAGAGWAGEKMSGLARKISPSTFETPEQKQRQQVLANMPADVDIYSVVKEQMQKMSFEKASEMQIALEKAMKTKEDGRTFSPEELAEFERIFKSALDSSDNLTNMARQKSPIGRPQGPLR